MRATTGCDGTTPASNGPLHVKALPAGSTDAPSDCGAAPSAHADVPVDQAARNISIQDE